MLSVIILLPLSRPSRARGLKQMTVSVKWLSVRSRPSRARGLKLVEGLH